MWARRGSHHRGRRGSRLPHHQAVSIEDVFEMDPDLEMPLHDDRDSWESDLDWNDDVDRFLFSEREREREAEIKAEEEGEREEEEQDEDEALRQHPSDIEEGEEIEEGEQSRGDGRGGLASLISPQEHGTPSTSWPMLRRSSLTMRRMAHGVVQEEASHAEPALNRAPEGSWTPRAPSGALSGVPELKEMSKFSDEVAQMRSLERASMEEPLLEQIQTREERQQEVMNEEWKPSILQKAWRIINWRDIMTGIINSVIAIPVLASFAAIIFSESVFDPVFSRLGKFVFLSSAVHQTIFTLGSSMHYAVGQVQDVGLIFLSAIASDIVSDCARVGVSESDTIGTVLVGLSLVTIIIGTAIIITGMLKFASLVQFCPVPVVGGYLAYVGVFCFMAGVSQSTAVGSLTSLSSLAKLLDINVGIHLVPCLVLTAILLGIQRRCRSPFVLPSLLVAVPVLFYCVLWLGDWSVEDAQRNGWLVPPETFDDHWRPWSIWKLYSIHSWPPTNIYWASLPRQIGKVLGLYVAVAFGSSMDVAAVQTEAPEELDYNKELVTVGGSNLVAGCLGVGLTGSYIFSQTLFSMHQGVTSSWMGAVIACIELAIAASPLQLASYIPRFYFGSLLCFIGFDIMMDWLIVATKKVSRTEYALLIFTFLAVLNLGLELGIASGIVAASLMFSIAYSSTSAKAISVVPSRSGSVRPFHERIVLELFNARIAAVMLRGFLYFGSAAALTDHTVELAENILLKQPHVEAIDATSPAIADSSEPERVDPFASSSDFRPRNLTERRRTNPKTYNLGSSSSSSLLHKLLVASYDKHTVQMIASSPSQPSVASVAAALTEAPLVCLLDMSRVLGMDATAARALLTLHNRLNRRGVALALTGLRDDEPGRRLRRLLFGQGVILKQSATRSEDGITWDNDSDTLVSSDGRDASAEGIVFATDGNINRPDRGTPLEQFEITSDSAHIDWFPTMDAGMSHFEEIFLGIGRKHGLCPPSIHRMSIEETLRLNLMVPPLDFGGQVPDFAAASRLLEARCERKMVQAGDLLWRLGEDSNAFFILESASISCVADTTLKTAHARAVDASLPEELRGPSSYSPKRILRYGPGGIVGDLDFILERPRSVVALCVRTGAVFRLERSKFASLASEAPQVYAIVQAMILRLNCLSASHAFDVHDRSWM